MTIDEAIEYLTDFSIYSPYQEAIDKVSVYIEQFQADYENRLKADMVAILTELQLEIEDIFKEEELIDEKWANGLHYSEKIIQQKINALKGEEDEYNSRGSKADENNM